MLTMQTLSSSGIATIKSEDSLSVHLSEAGCMVWVDVLDPTEAELNVIASEFGLHHLFIEDATKRGQRPKLEQLDDYAFLVAYTARLGEVHLFFAEDWMVSVRSTGAVPDQWTVQEGNDRWLRLTEVQSLPRDRIDLVLYSVLDAIVDEYFHRNAHFEDDLEALETAILNENLGDERWVQTRMLHLRRDMIQFRRKLSPLREVISQLTHHEVSFVDGPSVVYLQDVEDHLLRCIDELDVQRELLGNTMDAHLALMSNRTNRVMKMMTSIGAILLGSTLIAGVYGMNFRHMPELDWQYGYYFALALMATLTVFLTWWFRKRDWL
jgi:magnesium transporter